MFYLCSCSEKDTGGIYLLDFDGKTIREMGFTPLPGANYLAFSPDHKFLYSTWNEGKNGGVAAFRITPETHELTMLNRLESSGSAACHLCCDRNGKHLWCANYSSGNIAQFSLAADGSLQTRDRVITHHGSGPNAKRQETAHTHCCVITPDGKYLTVMDLGMDRIFFYPLDDASGICGEPKYYATAPGAGPRHIVFSANGHRAYTANELGNTAECLDYRDGSLSPRSVASTLPPDFHGATKCAAIRLSPDETHLYVSNRGFDSIVCFSILPNGELRLVSLTPSRGESPRDIALLDNGKYLICTNEFSDSVICFAVAPDGLRHIATADETKYIRPLNVLEISEL